MSGEDGVADLQIKCHEQTLLLSRMREENDVMYHAFYEEARKMLRLAQEHLKRVFDEHEIMNMNLEKRRKQLESWSKELNEHEAMPECEKQKLDKNNDRNNSLPLVSRI